VYRKARHGKCKECVVIGRNALRTQEEVNRYQREEYLEEDVFCIGSMK